MIMLDAAPAATGNLTVLLPKNGGLTGQVDRWLDTAQIPSDAQYVRVRGEDVPLLADELGRAGRRVLAFSGDDLVDEWLALGNTLCDRLTRDRIAWQDPEAIYGAPALCLIGRAGDGLFPGISTRRVAVCARYRALAARFMSSVRRDGVVLEPVLVSGALETFVESGVTDFAIDIVVTGKTLARAGLAVRRVISTSDLAVLESK